MQPLRRRTLAALAALACAAPAAFAAGFPERPVRLILPYAAGGPTDAVARALAQKMAAELGQPVVVENKGGASGDIATDFVAKAPADGHTVLYHSSGIALSPALKKKPVYDPIRDFAPVSWVATIPGVLVVNPKLPVNNVGQFVQHLKANPSKLAYGSGGKGNGSHLAMVQFLQAQGAEATHVPYKGTNPALMDLIGGQVQFMLDAISTSLPHIRDHKLRVLAVTGLQRSPLLPDVPTLNESGMPGYSFQTWHGLLVPTGTPAAVVQRLNAAAVKAANDPDIQRQFSAQGVVMRGTSPAEFGTMLKNEVAYWAQAVKAAGIEPE